MNILVVDGFSRGSEGRRRFQCFRGMVDQAFAKCWAHGTRVEVRKYNDVGEFVPASSDGIIRVTPIQNFDKLDFVFIDGDLPLADLPGAWNDAMEDLLGIRPPDDRQGCLQDIHWYDGAWGYFPTYTMGAMAAAQLFAAAKAAQPEIPDRIAEGDFMPLVGWMRENLHAKGSSASTDELMEAATGKPLGADDFKAHLQARYG